MRLPLLSLIALTLLPRHVPVAERAAAPDRAVPLYVTVAGTRSESAARLTIDDFVVLDNGKPQAIAGLLAGDVPVALSVVIDLSDDMYLQAPRLIPATETLLRNLQVDGRPAMRFTRRSWQPSDEWRAVGFKIGPDLRRLGFGFPLTRPLLSECEWAMTAVAFRQSRRVLVVVADGRGRKDVDEPADLLEGETFDETSEPQFLDYVDREDVLVYAIGFDGSHFDDAVRRAAVRSGGTVTVLPRDADLNVTFRQIAAEIRSQYIVRFEPEALDGKRHTLVVQVKREGSKARARTEYTASRRPAVY